MSIVLVGGMDRLGEKYHKEAKKQGMRLQIFSQADNNMAGRIKAADAVVIFTNKVSHQARNEAFSAAKKLGITGNQHYSRRGRVSHKDYQQQQTDNDKIAKITDIK